MRFRKLRIAWSVVCSIVCVLLIVLWVRSYWIEDSIERISFSQGVISSLQSTYGTLGFVSGLRLF
jgi:hypothetical protein